MSSNDILTTLTRPEEANSERLNQSTSSPVEPKQSIENVLLESKRLIKSVSSLVGFYRIIVRDFTKKLLTSLKP
jgi:hypothetical protein